MPFEPEEAAPVRLNMTPMIDVVFQLIVFFLCSMEFRSLDWKIDTKLPDDRGVAQDDRRPPEVPKLTIQLRSTAAGDTVVKSGGLTLGRLAEGSADATLRAVRVLTDSAIARSGGLVAAREAGLLCELDAGPHVATGHVLNVADVFVAAKVPQITFAGTPEPGRAPR